MEKLPETERNLPEDLRICAEATPGPWRRKGGNIYADDRLIMRLPPMPRLSGTFFEVDSVLSERSGNSRFIAEARTGWPRAIERALRAEYELSQRPNITRAEYEMLLEDGRRNYGEMKALEAEVERLRSGITQTLRGNSSRAMRLALIELLTKGSDCR